MWSTWPGPPCAAVPIPVAHARVVNLRKDAQEKATLDDIVRRAQARRHAVVVEDRGVRGMARNRRLARAVSDAALGGFILGPDAKCKERGVPFMKVGRGGRPRRSGARGVKR